jgi:hypothetical protein
MLARAEQYAPYPVGWTLPSVLAHADCSLVQG